MGKNIKKKMVHDDTPDLKTVPPDLNQMVNNGSDKQKVNECFAGKMSNLKTITFIVTGNHK